MQRIFYTVGCLAFVLWIAEQLAWVAGAGTINKPNTFVAGTAISPSQVNANFDTIYNEFNGNIGSVNILDGTILNADVNTSADIAISKLNTTSADFDSTGLLRANVVDTVEITNSAVTTAKVNDDAITFAKVDTTVMPAGAMLDYAGTSAPAGWLLCYGQAISRTTYAELFTAISTTYGTGDGSTTFNLPDTRGRVTAGEDDMGGSSANRLTASPSGSINGDTANAAGGTEGHTLTTAEMPSHTHPVPFGAPTAGATAIAGTGNAPTATVNSDATGGGGAHNNVQPTIIVRKIICTGGV